WWVVVILVSLGGIMRGVFESNNSSSSRAPSYGYSSPKHGLGGTGFDNLRGRLHTDPATGANPPVSYPFNIPPLHELLDPSKYDVEPVGSRGSRLLCFTPRPGAKITGSDRWPGVNAQPVHFGEASLRLMGVTREQMDELFARAAGKLLDGTQ